MILYNIYWVILVLDNFIHVYDIFWFHLHPQNLSYLYPILLASPFFQVHEFWLCFWHTSLTKVICVTTGLELARHWSIWEVTDWCVQNWRQCSPFSLNVLLENSSAVNGWASWVPLPPISVCWWPILAFKKIFLQHTLVIFIPLTQPLPQLLHPLIKLNILSLS